MGPGASPVGVIEPNGDRRARLRALPRPARVDVAIVGAGLAGAVLALVLARRGVSVAVVDVAKDFKADFRCEKLNPRQLGLLAELDVLDAVRAAVPAGGQLSDSGFRYDQLVNAVRAAWPKRVQFIAAKVSAIGDMDEDGAGRTVASSDGALAHARLVVVATGLSPKLAHGLGLERRAIRDQQSMCVGFSLIGRDGGPLPFAGLVERGRKAGDRIGFASLFRVGRAMRVNIFSYHDPRDAWVRAAKADPLGALLRAAPGLAGRLAGAQVTGPVEVRCTDLYRAEGCETPGVVLIGDAFQTSCPATGYGVTRLLTDIRQLATAHLPAWLETPGMGADKIAAFYADPVKTALDAEALRKAAIGRSAAVETGLRWRAYRLASKLKRTVGRAR